MNETMQKLIKNTLKNFKIYENTERTYGGAERNSHQMISTHQFLKTRKYLLSDVF